VTISGIEAWSWGVDEVKGMFHAWYIAIIVAIVATAVVVLDAAPLFAGCGTSGC
jgi:hypothetical protein